MRAIIRLIEEFLNGIGWPLLLVAVVVGGGTTLRGEPLKLTRQQASDLYVALVRVEPGLAVDNVIAAADDLTVLKPVVEALDKVKIAGQRESDLLPDSAERAVKAWAIRGKIDALCLDEVVIEITRFDLSPDEIKTAKITPAILAPLRQFLRKK